MARRKSRESGSITPNEGGAPAEEGIGKLLAARRERRGLSAGDVAHQAGIPAHYMKMIENDDYRLIADQLYLLPFLRRYAAFVELDGEEIAMRFVREVQRADSNATRMAEPMRVREKRSRVWVGAVIAGLAIAAGAIAIAEWRYGIIASSLLR